LAPGFHDVLNIHEELLVLARSPGGVARSGACRPDLRIGLDATTRLERVPHHLLAELIKSSAHRHFDYVDTYALGYLARPGGCVVASGWT
jgi:hypothetical protein